MAARAVPRPVRLGLFVLLMTCVSCMRTAPGSVPAENAESQCACDGSPHLQVLGSGGPMHAAGRGGSAYALWLADKPAIVVDMGADTPTALSRAGAAPASVDVLLLSHLHADHVSGVPDFLWGELVAERQRALIVVGPDGNQDFPSVPDFLKRLTGAEGAFPTLRGLQRGNPFALQITTLPVAHATAQPVLERGDVTITALPVPHGPAPALAYRLDGPRFSVVLAGDQSGSDQRFVEFAAGTDVLVLHAMVNDRAKDHRLAGVIGTPQRLGSLARESGARRVVLSHLMGQSGESEQARLWSLSDLGGVLESIQREYSGPVTVASDLMCIDL